MREMITTVKVLPTSAHATATMRANRGKDTRPELALRRELHRRGARYRTNMRVDLADGRRVRPDVVFTAARLAVFVDGCFWHGCGEHRSIPKRNTEFWRQKIEATRRRDKRNDGWLVAEGWLVVRLWEHVPAKDAADAVLLAVAHARQDISGWVTSPQDGISRDLP
jgi:DNA mismatch endonuclease (patch repair protein)